MNRESIQVVDNGGLDFHTLEKQTASRMIQRQLNGSPILDETSKTEAESTSVDDENRECNDDGNIGKDDTRSIKRKLDRTSPGSAGSIESSVAGSDATHGLGMDHGTVRRVREAALGTHCCDGCGNHDAGMAAHDIPEKQHTSGHSVTEEMLFNSMEEVKSYILQNMSPEAKERIPDETWENIWDQVQQIPTHSTGKNRSRRIEMASSVDCASCRRQSRRTSAIEVDDTAASIVSELSEPTVDSEFFHGESHQLLDRTPKVAARRSSFSLSEEVHETCRKLSSHDRWLAFSRDSTFSLTPTTPIPDEMPSPPSRRRTINSSTSSAPQLPFQLRPVSDTTPSPPSRRRTMNHFTTAASSPPHKPQRQNSVDHRPKRKVIFHTVDVRFYENVIEINPSVSSGVAVGIGWSYSCGNVLFVDEWESQKVGLTRRGRDLLLPRSVRERMVLDAGYRRMDIVQATRQTLKLKNQRKATVDKLRVEDLAEHLVGVASKVVKKIVAEIFGGDNEVLAQQA